MKKKTSEILYMKYEYLAKKYSSKIFSYDQISFEYEDLLQEFRMKIFTSIKSYGRRWAKYRRNEASKPVPLKYYLEAACSNKVRDFIKDINKQGFKVRIDEIDFDYGIEDNTVIATESNRFILNGINLLEGLKGKERSVFSLFLRGYDERKLNKVYFNRSETKIKKKVVESGDIPFSSIDIIESQKSFLIKKYGNELSSNKVYSSYRFDEE